MAEKPPEKTPVAPSKTFFAVVAAVPTLVSAFVGYQTYKLDSELARITVQFEQEKAQSALNFQLYTIVKEALGGTRQQQQAALVLVSNLGEDPFREQLIQTFIESESSDPSTTLQAVGLSLGRTSGGAITPGVQAQMPPSGPTPVVGQSPVGGSQNGSPDASAVKWGNWDFDLFYCAGSVEGLEQASRLAQVLANQEAEGRIRTRPLSAAVNARSGYRVKGHEIRYDRSELAMANQLKAVADTALSEQGVTFKTRVTTSKTNWYISAFFCPA